jgi:guanine deaminase
VGLEYDIGDFESGKAADFVYLRAPAGSVLESVVRHADTPKQTLASLFTLAGAESVREVRVEGKLAFAMGE